MATWVPASQLLLIALFSGNVLCYPARNGWSQRDPTKGSFANMELPPGLHYSSSQSAPAMEAPPGLHYSSSQSAPAQPLSASYPAVSFLYEPVKEGVYSSPATYHASPTPAVSSVASWNAAPGWAPMAESTTTNTKSRTSQPMPNIGSLPPPPLFQAGELQNYQANFDHGNSERETEELSFAPAPPPPPYPGPDFQAGELSRYASIYETGNEERETEEQGFAPLPPYALAARGPASPSEGVIQPVPQEVGPDQYYLFLTGQLPPGTLSHFQADYETGRDRWGEVHYERYDFPSAQLPILPTQTKEVPSDGRWPQPQDYTKA